MTTKLTKETHASTQAYVGVMSGKKTKTKKGLRANNGMAECFHSRATMYHSIWLVHVYELMGVAVHTWMAAAIQYTWNQGGLREWGGKSRNWRIRGTGEQWIYTDWDTYK